MTNDKVLELAEKFYLDDEIKAKQFRLLDFAAAIEAECSKELDEAKRTIAELEIAAEARDVKIASMAGGSLDNTCACSYDTPSDVCSSHSPMLKQAEKELAAAQAEITELREALKYVVDLYGSRSFGNCLVAADEQSPAVAKCMIALSTKSPSKFIDKDAVVTFEQVEEVCNKKLGSLQFNGFGQIHLDKEHLIDLINEFAVISQSHIGSVEECTRLRRQVIELEQALDEAIAKAVEPYKQDAENFKKCEKLMRQIVAERWHSSFAHNWSRAAREHYVQQMQDLLKSFDEAIRARAPYESKKSTRKEE